MSLINEMLENLDDRQPSARRSQSAMLEGLASTSKSGDSEPPRGGPGWLTCVSIALLVLLIGLVLWDDGEREPSALPVSPLPQYAIGPEIPPPDFDAPESRGGVAYEPAMIAYGAPPQAPRGFPPAQSEGSAPARQASEATPAPARQASEATPAPARQASEATPAPPRQASDATPAAGESARAAEPDPIDLPAAEPPTGRDAFAGAAPTAPADPPSAREIPAGADITEEQPLAARDSQPAPARRETSARPRGPSRSTPSAEDRGLLETARELLGVQERTPTARDLAEESYRFGLGLAAADQREASMHALRDALALDARHTAARAALARLLIESEKIDDARALLGQGLALDPTYAEFKVLDAHAALVSGEVRTAARILAQMPIPVEGNVEYHATLAAAYQRLQDHPRALDQYRRLLALDRENPSWWLGLAISLEAGGQRGHALMAYRSASSLGTLAPEARRFVAGRVASLERSTR